MSARISFWLCLWLCLLPGLAAAEADCPVDTPQNSPLWQVFQQFLEQEYGFSKLAPDERAKVSGHALGRIASGVQGSREREEVFSCIRLGIEQYFGLEVLRFSKRRAKLVHMAAMGMYDPDVAAMTGVKRFNPPSAIFAATMTSLVSPGGAAVSNSGASRGGNVVGGNDWRCRNPMTTSLSRPGDSAPDVAGTRASCDALDKSSEFRARFVTPNTCVVCAVEDVIDTPPPPVIKPDTWEAAFRDRGISLPTGAQFYQQPKIPAGSCKAPSIDPAWIAVTNGAVCKDGWKNLGSSRQLDHKASWCVYCPSGLRYQSGRGCCVK